MRHHSRFNVRDVCQRANDERARHADSKISPDQFVPDKALIGVEFAPGLQQQITPRIFAEMAEREQPLFNHFGERQVCSAAGIAQDERDGFSHVADGVVTFFEKPAREIRFGERQFPKRFARNSAGQSAAC